MTGLHGGCTSVRSNLGYAHLSDSDVTLAEMLKRAGYAAGAYGKWGHRSRGQSGASVPQGS